MRRRLALRGCPPVDTSCKSRPLIVWHTRTLRSELISRSNKSSKRQLSLRRFWNGFEEGKRQKVKGKREDQRLALILPFFLLLFAFFLYVVCLAGGRFGNC